MDIDQIKKDLLCWMEDFVEVSHEKLGGWPPCPFARRARLENKIDIRAGSDPYFDCMTLSRDGMDRFDVVIYAYDTTDWPYDDFHQAVELAQTAFLLPRGLVALEDHPGCLEQVNGVTMNQGHYALLLLQESRKLDDAAGQLAKKGYYHGWPELYLQVLFRHRQRPPHTT